MTAPPISPQHMARLHAAAFTQARPWSETEFTELLDSPLCFAVGGPDSFALVRVIADEAELLTIATNPARQRCGLGRACMLAWQKQARLRGATRAFLEVAADNHAAGALYESCGYAPVGLRKAYYERSNGPAVDALVLAHDLGTG